MEESEKRRKRLEAMRMEAAQVEDSNNVAGSTVPGFLSNPLTETSAALLAQEESCATPRFDFYTDPMAAFSANKKRSKVGDQDHFTPSSNCGSPMARLPPSLSATRSPQITPPPNRQLQGNYPPDKRMYQSEGPCYGATSQRSPIGNASPFPQYQRTLPGAWNETRSKVGRGIPYDQSMVGNLPSPSFGPVGSRSFHYGQGRTRWHGNSPSPNLGRGRGRWHGDSMSPRFGRSGGRGLGFRSRGLASDGNLGPECFYDKSMIEDPWECLKPVIWRPLDVSLNNMHSSSSSSSWLPKSIGMEKPRISEPFNKSSSQSSLAEYLAASFNEAVNDKLAE